VTSEDVGYGADALESPQLLGAVQKTSEANGKLVESVDSTFLSLTDFSPQLR